ncbi:MAG: hypothetical protein U5K28_00275 [Halobacteriales archaeon]|nr:hypothetical protein [Halobacteriales archaeon]
MMKEYLNITYRGYYVSRIVLYTTIGGISTIAAAAVVADSYGIKELALGMIVGFVLGLLFETFDRVRARSD